MAYEAGPGDARSPRGLWLARELPFPADMGDRIYTARLARALAEAGADVTFSALRTEDRHLPPADWPVKWSVVAGRRRSTFHAAISAMPLVAASYATAPYRAHVRSMLAEGKWDFVVIDQLALGWALKFMPKRPRPLLVYVAHNHESSLWESFYRDFDGPLPKRIALWQNYVKTRTFERALASRADLVTAITEADAEKFSREIPGIRTVVLKPGFDGTVSKREKITELTPRRVVLVGSFQWSIKQENLRQFVKIADPVFARHGIEFLVVGTMPAELAKELEAVTSATRFMGFVEDLQPVLETARIAVVPEAIGGGFKLKLLDYVFGRLPVAAITHATAGLPDEVRSSMLCTGSLGELAELIARRIDDLAQLNFLQETALRHAVTLFRWSDRGVDLLRAIQSIGRCSSRSCRQ